MPPQIREILSASSAVRALALLQRDDGQTEPLIVSPRPALDLFPHATAVVDLQPLGLDYILSEKEPSSAEQLVRIGAMTPLQTLVENPSSRALANGILAQAAYLSAHVGLRNLATLAGALIGASSDGEGPTEVLLALLALNADVLVQGAAPRQESLTNWHPTAHELLLEARIRRPAVIGGGLARVARTPADQAIVAAVAVVTETTGRVAVAGAGPHPFVVEHAINDRLTRTIINSLVEAVGSAAQPSGDARGSAEYRHAMAQVLARRALVDAFKHKAEL